MRGVLLLSVLAVLALLSSWFLAAIEASLQQITPQAETPILYMDNFLATGMNARGVREYAVAAPHLVQLPGAQGARLERPDIQVFRDGKIVNWTIRAEQGWIAPDAKLIRLEIAVSITRPASSGELPVFISTRELLIRPAEGLVETAEPVRMTIPGGSVQAVSLRVRPNEKKLELLSKVRSRYELSKF